MPERQREALALLEQEGLSYDDIAAKLDTTRACVGQLIAHARINLYDEVRGTILASVAPSPDCERAVGLIAAREDGELGEGDEASWLDAHLEDCDRCRRGVAEMRDAAIAGRASEVDGAAAASTASIAPPPRRRAALVAAAAVTLLVFAGVATAFVRNDSPAPTAEQTSGAAERSNPSQREGAGGARGGQKDKEGESKPRRSKAAAEGAPNAEAGSAAPATPTASEVPVAAPGPDEPTGGGGSTGRPSGKAGIDPPRETSTATPTPAATGSPTPSTAPAPAPVAESPPSEEPSEETPRRREPPGKPAHAGPK